MAPKKNRREFNPAALLIDEMTGEILVGRERPLTTRESLERWGLVRVQAVTVDMARRPVAEAKAELKERLAVLEREEDRLYSLCRVDEQGELFPATTHEVDEARRRLLTRSDVEDPDPLPKPRAAPLAPVEEPAGAGS